MKYKRDYQESSSTHRYNRVLRGWGIRFCNQISRISRPEKGKNLPFFQKLLILLVIILLVFEMIIQLLHLNNRTIVFTQWWGFFLISWNRTSKFYVRVYQLLYEKNKWFWQTLPEIIIKKNNLIVLSIDCFPNKSKPKYERKIFVSQASVQDVK